MVNVELLFFCFVLFCILIFSIVLLCGCCWLLDTRYCFGDVVSIGPIKITFGLVFRCY